MERLNRVVFCIIVLVASVAVASEGITWLSLPEGTVKSKAEKKPMIIDFYFGKGCPRCEALQKGVYDNPKLSRRIMHEFIPIRIDLTKKLTAEEENLGASYDYKNECLLLFLDSDGNIIKDQSGKRLCFIDDVDPDWFMKYLDMITAGARKSTGN